MTKYLRYEVDVAPVPDGLDVATQSLEVYVGDPWSLKVDEELDPAGGKAEFEAVVGDPVKVTLVYTDAAENESEPSRVEFVATDTVAPPAPASEAFTVKAVDERFEQDVPPVEPPVV